MKLTLGVGARFCKENGKKNEVFLALAPFDEDLEFWDGSRMQDHDFCIVWERIFDNKKNLNHKSMHNLTLDEEFCGDFLLNAS